MKARLAPQRAFTVLELLIVLAIIGLLAGLLFAAFGPARERARQTVCVSNLHQLRQALMLYQADYEGVDPVIGQRIQYWQMGLPTPSSPTSFYAFRDNYVKDPRLLICPDFVQPKIQKHLSTYYWCFGPDQYKPADHKFSRLASLLGNNVVLYYCDEHNRPFDIGNEPRWTQKRIILLRYNGQVQTKMVDVRDFTSFLTTP